MMLFMSVTVLILLVVDLALAYCAYDLYKKCARIAAVQRDLMTSIQMNRNASTKTMINFFMKLRKIENMLNLLP